MEDEGVHRSHFSDLQCSGVVVWYPFERHFCGKASSLAGCSYKHVRTSRRIGVRQSTCIQPRRRWLPLTVGKRRVSVSVWVSGRVGSRRCISG